MRSTNVSMHKSKEKHTSRHNDQEVIVTYINVHTITKLVCLVVHFSTRVMSETFGIIRFAACSNKVHEHVAMSTSRLSVQYPIISRTLKCKKSDDRLGLKFVFTINSKTACCARTYWRNTRLKL